MDSVNGSAHSESLEIRVKEFLAEYLDEPIAKFQNHCRIEEDLNYTGSDAAELIDAFAIYFEVTLENLDFHKHFGPEGCNPFWLLLPPIWLKDHGKYPVTVQHLINVAEAKAWFEPPKVDG
ncbi:MAG: DUF1493 family protein [Chthonomonadales bacterium]